MIFFNNKSNYINNTPNQLMQINAFLSVELLWKLHQENRFGHNKLYWFIWEHE